MVPALAAKMCLSSAADRRPSFAVRRTPPVDHVRGLDHQAARRETIRMAFNPPSADLLFALRHVAGLPDLTDAFPDADPETVEAILHAASEFARDVIAPLNRIGDQKGAVYANGRVTAAPGYADAYRQFAAGGWNSLAADPAYGGQGLPKAIELAVFEMVQSASLAFGLCPMLTLAGIEALHAYGSDRQKALYLPKMISGEWTGTMNLTEPQAGSDLAAITTMARPDGNGGWLLNGQKIYITWGDHDAADNIVHLIIARTPDAPPGVKGISLFLTTSVAVDEAGELGARNAVRPASIEHKLGIHGSPTCVMLYEGSTAELVGEIGQGLPQMFTMMNAARLQVGVQGVAIAERAYQQALGFARERKQGRSVWSGQSGALIYDHPDVRRTLALMKARIEAARGLCLSTGVAADLARRASTEAARDHARRREEFLTPIAKAWSTDMGVWAASAGVQVHGGMGFIEETGAAQHYRDARILPIYEGTNGIQAGDLAGRKLGMDGGAALCELAADVRIDVSRLKEVLPAVAARLDAGVDAMQAAGAWLAEKRGTADAAAGASAFLQLCGDVCGGWMLARGALADPEGQRPALARLYAEQVLAGAPGLAAAVVQGAEDLAMLELA
jgi:alkylation response protein AidB-like acyl-CoA dehydrogenase